MSEINKGAISWQIFNLCSTFYNYEKYINFKTHNNKKDKGCLIESKIMEKFKQNILYNELRADIIESQPYSILKDKIEKICKTKEIKKLEQTKFNTNKELLDILDKNKKFYLINSELWYKTCEEKNRMDFGINYILDNDKIILIFNDNDKLIFKNNNGIIEKSLLYNTENNINQIHNLINNDETSYNSEGPKNEQISNINSPEKSDGKQTIEIEKENKIYLKYEKEFDIIVSLIYNNYLIKEE